jgi:hypothetical protein
VGRSGRARDCGGKGVSASGAGPARGAAGGDGVGIVGDGAVHAVRGEADARACALEVAETESGVGGMRYPAVTRVALTAEDRELARAFFLLMRAVKPNQRRTVLSDRDREAFEIAGKLGEICLGRALGVPVDWTVSPHGADHGIDVRLPDGRTVDVKAVAVEANLDYDFKLTFGAGEFRADIAVLALIAPDATYGLLAGAITAAAFAHASVEERGWGHRGDVCPRVVRRAQLAEWRAVCGLWILDDEEVA